MEYYSGEGEAYRQSEGPAATVEPGNLERRIESTRAAREAGVDKWALGMAIGLCVGGGAALLYGVAERQPLAMGAGLGALFLASGYGEDDADAIHPES